MPCSGHALCPLSGKRARTCSTLNDWPIASCPRSVVFAWRHDNNRAGGYVPSSSAADDYLNSLKADSQKRQKETQANLRGEPLPPREGPLLSASPPTETATSDKVYTEGNMAPLA